MLPMDTGNRLMSNRVARELGPARCWYRYGCAALALLVSLSGPVAIRPAVALDLVNQSLNANGQSVTLRVPRGMQVEFLASAGGARLPALGPDDEILIGSNSGNVYRLAPPYTSAETLVEIGTRSHSVAWDGARLLVADTSGLYAAPYAGLATNLAGGDFVRLVEFPVTGGHSSRSVTVNTGGEAYVGIGISGNCSDQYLAGESPDYPFEDRRGGVWRIDESGADPALVVHSSGLRNPIGIAFHPGTGDLWATNAGSDNLGYHLPREIFARLGAGSWHGMPWFQYIEGEFVAQDCINSTPPRPASEATPPSLTFDARSTPMGIAFISSETLGEDFTGNAVVAIHGSWATNGGPSTRRPPKLVLVRFESGQPVAAEDLVTGFQYANGNRFARPAGVIEGQDGNIYFTSDGGTVHGLFRLRTREIRPPSGLPPQDFCLPLASGRRSVIICDDFD